MGTGIGLHSLQSDGGVTRRRKRVGRGVGSGRGKTSGRGHKGQYARSGHKHKPGFEGGQMRFVRRLPKRGFGNVNRKELLPVNVADLACFDDGVEVTVDALRKAGLAKGPCDGVKILGTGELAKKLKVMAAGGTCEIVKASG